MNYFLKIWLAGWLIMVAWYLVSAIIFFPKQKPERRWQLVRENAIESLYCLLLWPLAMLMLIFLGFLNRRQKH